MEFVRLHGNTTQVGFYDKQLYNGLGSESVFVTLSTPT